MLVADGADPADAARSARRSPTARCLLAVCGGYQLLGHRYRGHQGDEIPGTGLVDLETVAGDTRHHRQRAGRLPSAARSTMVGFENHAGRTWLGAGVAAARPGDRGRRQQRRGPHRGLPRRAHRRHLRARPAAAEEPVDRRRADRPRAGAARRRSRSRRWTTRSRRARPRARRRSPGPSAGNLGAVQTYVLLSTLSAERRRDAEEEPEPPPAGERAGRGDGREIVSQWAVLGPYDFVTILEAPDHLTVAQIAVELGCARLDPDPEPAGDPGVRLPLGPVREPRPLVRRHSPTLVAVARAAAARASCRPTHIERQSRDPRVFRAETFWGSDPRTGAISGSDPAPGRRTKARGSVTLAPWPGSSLGYP